MEQHQELDALVAMLRRAHERQIEAARQQPGQQPDRFVLEQLDRDIRMMLAKIVQQDRQQSGRGRIDGAHLRRRCRPRARSRMRRSSLVGLRQQRPRLVEKLDTFRRERDIARRAQEQARAQALFQQADMPAERGRQHVEPPRGSAEVQFLRDRDETA